LHNPVKIAEQGAIVDVLSNGRLELGCGRGTAPLHYAGYNIPQEESRERFDEALDFLLGAWTHESFTFEGKYFRARDLTIVPRPLQSPHPPVRIAANSPDTFPFAARRHLPIFATPMINPPDKLKAGLAVYRNDLAGVHGDTALAFPVHVAASREHARAECEPSLMRFMREAAERLRPLGDHDVKSFEAFRQVLARMDRITFADIDHEMGVFGDPAYCVERVRELQRDYGMDEFICYFNQGGLMPRAMVQQSMTMFAREVIPHFR
jgi:alkanesulfonate monooxygenase SsuD/methylene tetrahydromethanopterin reductase-like flavin-dependent oxidoreductase (luciferase family)